MKIIDAYVSEDGNVFWSREECLAHEALCGQVSRILSLLSVRPNGREFSNGAGYLQHDISILIKVANLLLDIINQRTPGLNLCVDLKTFSVRDFTETMRRHAILPAMKDADYRFMCIDENMREWGEPYFVRHPENGKPIRLN